MTRQFAFRGGHVIREDLAIFDASFFSISPTKAEGMDPLQRGLLKTYYRALENGSMASRPIHTFLESSLLRYYPLHSWNHFASSQGLQNVCARGQLFERLGSNAIEVSAGLINIPGNWNVAIAACKSRQSVFRP